MTASPPPGRPPKDNRRRARAALHMDGPGSGPGSGSGPGAYAVVFLDDAGAPASVVATFPGPMSAEMYGKITGGRFRVVRMDPAHPTR